MILHGFFVDGALRRAACPTRGDEHAWGTHCYARNGDSTLAESAGGIAGEFASTPRAISNNIIATLRCGDPALASGSWFGSNISADKYVRQRA